MRRVGTQFSRFTGTKVQILTPELLQSEIEKGKESKSALMRKMREVYSVYLLYWYEGRRRYHP